MFRNAIVHTCKRKDALKRKCSGVMDNMGIIELLIVQNNYTHGTIGCGTLRVENRRFVLICHSPPCCRLKGSFNIVGIFAWSIQRSFFLAVRGGKQEKTAYLRQDFPIYFCVASFSQTPLVSMLFFIGNKDLFQFLPSQRNAMLCSLFF